MNHLLTLPFIHTLDRYLSEHHKTPFLYVLLGPRQVGKTTTILNYLKEQHPDRHHYVSADQVFITINSGHLLLQQWWAEAKQQKKILVIDEIQKIEGWSSVLKKIWDEERRSSSGPGSILRCVLLGSSSLALHQGLTESLTGRFRLLHAHHWNATESAEGYGLSVEEFLKFGGYPASYPLRTELLEWKNYVQHSIVNTVVEKDILVGQRVKSPSLFRQAFELACSYPAQEISYNKLLGQLQERGNTELIKHYLQLFEGAFLIKTLQKYSPKATLTKSSSPKIIPLCPAFYYLQDLGEYTSAVRGRVFEALVGQTLLRLGYELYYWRDGQDEVDYVLKLGKQLWAIEVKSAPTSLTTTNGLSEFIKRHPKAKPVVITPDNYLQLERTGSNFFN